MTLQDMCNHKEHYNDDDDDDDDSDWEPFQKHVSGTQWFCTNCTMVNLDDVLDCDVCGENKDSENLSYGSFVSRLAQEVGQTRVKSNVVNGYEGSGTQKSALDSCTVIGFDERMLLHSEVEMKLNLHPERPDRLRAIAASLSAAGIFPGRCIPIPAREITQEELQMVHSVEHIQAVEFTSCMLSSYFTPDTYANEHSACAARLAAGLCADLSSAIMSGRAKNGFALVRPPGHHAGVKEAMGFCLHNNAAVAALAAQGVGAKRVLIVDWDVHHGNGTQEIFEGSKSVLYVSLHRHEGGRFYPGTGAADEVGINGAEGYCVNVPWNCGGVGDNDYIFAFKHIVLPIALAFSPDLTIVSAGFDAARGDPLGCCDVTPAGYALMTHMLMSLSSGKMLVILEGGYNLRSISTSATAVIKVLLGESPGCEVDGVSPSKSGLQTVLNVLKIQQKFWPNLESDLGKLQAQQVFLSLKKSLKRKGNAQIEDEAPPKKNDTSLLLHDITLIEKPLEPKSVRESASEKIHTSTEDNFGLPSLTLRRSQRIQCIHNPSNENLEAPLKNVDTSLLLHDSSLAKKPSKLESSRKSSLDKTRTNIVDDFDLTSLTLRRSQRIQCIQDPSKETFVVGKVSTNNSPPKIMKTKSDSGSHPLNSLVCSPEQSPKMSNHVKTRKSLDTMVELESGTTIIVGNDTRGNDTCAQVETENSSRVLDYEENLVDLFVETINPSKGSSYLGIAPFIETQPLNGVVETETQQLGARDENVEAETILSQFQESLKDPKAYIFGLARAKEIPAKPTNFDLSLNQRPCFKELSFEELILTLVLFSRMEIIDLTDPILEAFFTFCCQSLSTHQKTCARTQSYLEDIIESITLHVANAQEFRKFNANTKTYEQQSSLSQIMPRVMQLREQHTVLSAGVSDLEKQHEDLQDRLARLQTEIEKVEEAIREHKDKLSYVERDTEELIPVVEAARAHAREIARNNQLMESKDFVSSKFWQKFQQKVRKRLAVQIGLTL